MAHGAWRTVAYAMLARGAEVRGVMRARNLKTRAVGAVERLVGRFMRVFGHLFGSRRIELEGRAVELRGRADVARARAVARIAQSPRNLGRKMNF
jgi:hypothetical protein